MSLSLWYNSLSFAWCHFQCLWWMLVSAFIFVTWVDMNQNPIKAGVLNTKEKAPQNFRHLQLFSLPLRIPLGFNTLSSYRL